MPIKRSFCFTHDTGEDVFLFTLFNTRGTEVRITNYGAIISSLILRSGYGAPNDIVLGFDDIRDYLSASYLSNYPYMGAVCGRYANRIKGARFSLNGREYRLKSNLGEDCLHGGKDGFDKKLWQIIPGSDEDKGILSMRYLSRDGEEGFPGNLETSIHFELTEQDQLIYQFYCTTDKPTPVNLTHHSYFNLHNGTGTIEDHELRIPGSRILAQDESLVCNGDYIPVENSNYDFRAYRRIHQAGFSFSGYDQCFEIDDKTSELSEVAEVKSKSSGIRMQILSTEPTVQFYTGQGLHGLRGKNNTLYGPYSGLCLETHKHPNAINIPHFPDTVLKPGETYIQKTVYNFFRED